MQGMDKPTPVECCNMPAAVGRQVDWLRKSRDLRKAQENQGEQRHGQCLRPDRAAQQPR
eukprot:CAMPEP_0181493428 /NCGR_PEP_ID=MMETSP1110-20121109/51220_1 /TAXON_ID=174948 /ORGANISM="Symbiodinium sp., Strain CCMP421" /LENGTH=58 /DNA_ID=CAMNT_0023620747 /DNA_START=231 /DNA_END=403 /DNA_ORIENTATION=-